MNDVTHQSTAELVAFQKVNGDLRRCFDTWEQAGIPPNLALWAAVSLITDTLRAALGNDTGAVAQFMLSAMNTSLKNEEAS
jgi:hypothetical protein